MAVNVKFKFTVDKRAMSYFSSMPNKLQEAKTKAVTAAGMAWSDEAKNITTNDGHIDTGLYVNSIGYVTGSPATESDTIHELSEGTRTSLQIGSAVEYAAALEKRYNIFARAIDSGETRMKRVAETQIKNTLSL